MASLIIGVTGTIGVGKSSVARMLKAQDRKGVLLLDADKIARRFLRKGSSSSKIVMQLFPRAVNKKGELDKKKLADLVFNNKKNMSSLNGFIHPFVIRAIKQKLEKFPQKIIILDVPLLVEADMLQTVNKLIVVDAKKNQVLKRSRFSKKDLERRQKNQLSFKKKWEEAIKKLGKENVFVVDNSLGPKETKQKVKELWQQLKIE